MSILTKIRQRPDHEKRIFSFVGAGVLTVVILIVWLSVGDDSVETQIAAEDKLSSLSPAQVIKDEFSKAFSNFKENTENMNDIISSSTIPIEEIIATTTATSIDE